MECITWIKNLGEGAVCFGSIPDGAYDEETCIIVPTRPSQAHRWNNELKEWTLSLIDKQNEIRGLRDPEIIRTDKYLLADFFAKFTESEQSEIIVYRQALRDAPNKEKIEELVMPVCPDCIKP